MTMLEERQQTSPPQHRAPAAGHFTEWIVGVVGAIAAAIGGWMYYGPSEGTLSLFGWDWDVADLAEAWPLSLLIGGGLLLSAAFGWFATKNHRRDEAVTTSVFMGSVLGLAALAGAVVFLLIWIF